MATLTDVPAANTKRNRRIPKKPNMKIDMTPMVDLGFLLITFFVMTVELNKPNNFPLIMPNEGPPILVGRSNVLTLLIKEEGKVYYYEGDWNNKATLTTLDQKTGLGKIIREKQAVLTITKAGEEGKDGLMLLIKPSNEASYKQVVDALDETIINQVKKYALVSLSQEEMAYLKMQP